ncbi:hypothetical protein [Nocardiopsis oceani]
MSTTPEDNTSPETTTRSPEGGAQPKFEPGVATEAPENTETAEGSEAPADGQPELDFEEFEAAPAEPKPAGAFSAETLSIVAMVMLAVTVFSGQLLEILTSMILVGGQPIGPEQVAQIETQVMVGGAAALLTVLFSTLALALTNIGTRPWARWTGTAATIVGVLFVIAAAVAYFLIPEGAEQMMPPMME